MSDVDACTQGFTENCYNSLFVLSVTKVLLFGKNNSYNMPTCAISDL